MSTNPNRRATLLATLARYYGLNVGDKDVLKALEDEYTQNSDYALSTIVTAEACYLAERAARLHYLAPYAEAAHSNWASLWAGDEDGRLIAYVNHPNGDELLPWSVQEMLPRNLWPSCKTARPTFRVYNPDHRPQVNATYDEEDGTIRYYPIYDRVSAVRDFDYRTLEEYQLALNEWRKLSLKSQTGPVDFVQLQRNIDRVLAFVRGEPIQT